jgi:hypothetical protein
LEFQGHAPSGLLASNGLDMCSGAQLLLGGRGWRWCSSVRGDPGGFCCCGFGSMQGKQAFAQGDPANCDCQGLVCVQDAHSVLGKVLLRMARIRSPPLSVEALGWEEGVGGVYLDVSYVLVVGEECAGQCSHE